MRTELPEPQSPDRILARFLRLLGTLDLLALAVVLLPQETIARLHEAAGLGVLPRDATTGYLIRSTSALYALHGALLWWVSFDIARYRGMIAFLGWAAVVHGALLVGIDVSQGMPAWWTLIEGPSLAVIGIVVLLLLRRRGR
jgi:hypothetical protein